MLSFQKFFRSWWNALIHDPHQPEYLAGRKIKIVAVGGGTGLANLLRGLRDYTDHITAVVAVTDNGSSSGTLRRTLSILPPGDIRQCISALSEDEQLFSDIFEYRFSKEDGFLAGHSIGNLWLAALTKYFGSFEKAVEATSEIFKTRGSILPATLEKIDLSAIYTDGSSQRGESSLPQPNKTIERVNLNKNGVKAYSKALEAIKEADLILLGPGSLYTSIIPNLLIKNLSGEIRKNNRAVKVFIANCSTERGETENLDIAGHIDAIDKHVGFRIFEYCIVNSRIIKNSSGQQKIGEVNNITSKEKMIDGCRIVSHDIISNQNPLFHDSKKLASQIIKLYNTHLDSKKQKVVSLPIDR
jgi:uncharacterized cofD-like protein